RALGLRHNEARGAFATAVLDALADQAVDRIGAGWLAPREAPELAADLRADARAELRGHPGLRIVVDALWPELTPQRLLADLFTSPRRIDRAAAALPPADRAALARADGDAWTVSDVPLPDEAAELLGPPAAERAAARPTTAATRRTSWRCSTTTRPTTTRSARPTSCTPTCSPNARSRSTTARSPSAPPPTRSGCTGTWWSTRRRSCPTWTGACCCGAAPPARSPWSGTSPSAARRPAPARGPTRSTGTRRAAGPTAC